MPVNTVAENVLGTIGTICWTCQLIPQIWKSWREHSTAGLSHLLVCVPQSSKFERNSVDLPEILHPGLYGVWRLYLWPQLFGFLSLFSWGQCLYYDKKKSRLGACLIAGSVMIIVGAVEAGMIFAIRPSMNHRAIDFFGILASIVIAGGLLPQYWEIWQRKEVVGISMPFMVIDILGGVFSFLSLIFRPQFDIVAAVAYMLVVVLDSVVVVAALILNPRARRRRLATEVIDTESISSAEPREMALSSSATTTIITVPASGSSTPSKLMANENYSTEKC
ncbi:Uncharacterized protein C2E12.03c [Hypsizygus marmoreus]|uniref:Uncharacterized protein C2E12.03c n=1 Tax=Hypsizygus marmoreus TaxID=39966 RepID=A0A369JMI8_HYPMA|nr:Uncharacterized protein C2E12.03c [Hypsizygus marmoreus]